MRGYGTDEPGYNVPGTHEAECRNCHKVTDVDDEKELCDECWQLVSTDIFDPLDDDRDQEDPREFSEDSDALYRHAKFVYDFDRD